MLNSPQSTKQICQKLTIRFRFYEVQGSVQLDENLENSSHMTRFKDLPLGEENY